MQSAAKQFIDQELEYDQLYGSQLEQEQEAPRLTVSRRSGVLSVMGRVRLLLCAAMVVAIVSLSIYNNVAMVELGDRLSRQTTTLAQLQQEGEILKAKLDNSISLSEVASRASDTMLMGKAESYQITYISLSQGDVVQRTSKTPDQMPTQRVMRTISKLQEYMKNR